MGTGMAHLPPFIGLNEAAYRAHRKRPLPVKTVCVRTEPGGKNQEQGKGDEPVKNGAGSLAVCVYRKRKPLGALVHRARRSMRDAMSPRESRSLHTRRRLLSIALCGKDRLLLLMVSITLPSLRRYLGIN
jgi:hypothetical protein